MPTSALSTGMRGYEELRAMGYGGFDVLWGSGLAAVMCAFRLRCVIAANIG